MKPNGKYQQVKAPRPSGRGANSKRTRTKPSNQRLAGVIVRIAILARRHSLILRSSTIFIACLALSIFVYSKFIDENNNALIDLTARATGSILNFLGGNGVQVNGSLVSSSAFSMRIVNLCTGFVPAIIFVSAVLAYPCKLEQKIIGVIVGVAAIFSLNLIRMVSLFYFGIFIPGFFDTAHMLIWQSLMILLSIILWLFWAEKLAHGSAH